MIFLELTGFVTALAQTALKSFSKFSFVWKYYQVCKQLLTEARDAEDGHKEHKIL